MRRIYLPAFLVIALVSFVCAAPTTAPSSGTGSIHGTVTKDGQPLANMTVRLMQRPTDGSAPAAPDKNGDKTGDQNGKRERPARGTMIAETKTDSSGNFSFANLAAGSYLVVARDRETNVGGNTAISVGDSESATVSITAKEHKAGGKKHKN